MSFDEVPKKERNRYGFTTISIKEITNDLIEETFNQKFTKDSAIRYTVILYKFLKDNNVINVSAGESFHGKVYGKTVLERFEKYWIKVMQINGTNIEDNKTS